MTDDRAALQGAIAALAADPAPAEAGLIALMQECGQHRWTDGLAAIRLHAGAALGANFRLAINFADAMRACGDDEAALRLYAEAGALDPHNFWPYMHRAGLHKKAGRLDEAVAVLAQGIESCRGRATAIEFDNLVREYINLRCQASDADLVDWAPVLARPLAPGRPLANALRVSLVKDEEDIIFFSLANSYAAGLRYFVIADNGSSDGTAGEIDRFRRRHPDALVFTVTDPIVEYYQAEKTNALARFGAAMLAARGIDIEWIFPLDADEAIASVGGDGDLFAVLEDAAGKTMLVFMWCTVYADTPLPVLPAEGRATEYLNRCSGFRMAPVTKVACRLTDTLRIGMGNHFATGCVERADQVLALPESGFVLLHLPMRSVEQFRRKIVNGGRALEAATRLGREHGAHWRRDHDAYLAQGEALLLDRLGAFVDLNNRAAAEMERRRIG